MHRFQPANFLPSGRAKVTHAKGAQWAPFSVAVASELT